MQHLFLTTPSLDSGLISHNSVLNQETLQIGLFLIYFVPCVGSYSTKMNQTQTNTEIVDKPLLKLFLILLFSHLQ